MAVPPHPSGRFAGTAENRRQRRLNGSNNRLVAVGVGVGPVLGEDEQRADGDGFDAADIGLQLRIGRGRDDAELTELVAEQFQVVEIAVGDGNKPEFGADAVEGGDELAAWSDFASSGLA